MKWEKEFDKKYGVKSAFGGLWVMGGENLGQWRLVNKELKSFIRNLLQSKMSDLRKEVEKKRTETIKNHEIKHVGPIEYETECKSKVEALDEVLLLMKKK